MMTFSMVTEAWRRCSRFPLRNLKNGDDDSVRLFQFIALTFLSESCSEGVFIGMKMISLCCSVMLWCCCYRIIAIIMLLQFFGCCSFSVVYVVAVLLLLSSFCHNSSLWLYMCWFRLSLLKPSIYVFVGFQIRFAFYYELCEIYFIWDLESQILNQIYFRRFGIISYWIMT